MMVPSAAARRRLGGLRRAASLVFLGGLVAISVLLIQHYLHGGTLSLSKVNANNQGSGLGFGSSGVPYSSSPASFPRDIYEVLFNPLLFKAHGSSQRIAGLENTVLIVLILSSLRQIRIVPRASFARPYVMLCLTYTVAFIYTFAALGNLGLIERERAMLMPFFLVLFCIPRGPKGAPPWYPWELRRKQRLQLRAAIERAAAEKAAAERFGPRGAPTGEPVGR